MADNVQITAGTGTPVATDDIAGIHYQRVKLTDGTADSTTPISGDAANGLDVDVTRVGGVVHVDDNGGSLTVDGTVNVGNLPATQPVSGTVTATGPVTDTQLRASAVPVSLASVPSHPVTGTFWQATQPVSIAAAVDTSDRATREAGRSRIWDGTDEATVLSRGSVPTSADKGLCVVPLNVSRPAYQVVTTEITSATTTGVKENLTLWHPSSLLKDVFIIEIGANIRITQTAGTFGWELQFISAENATPGGTTLTAQQMNRGDPASGLTIRQVPTGAPTATGTIFQRASAPLPAAATPLVTFDGVVLYRAKDLDDYSDAITLRNGQAEGLRITQNVIAALTTAPVFTLYARYVERA